MDIFEILLLHVLSNDACKFAINLCPHQFRIKSCGTDYPRLEKDLNSFLSSGSKVVEWSSQGLTSHGHFWNSTFACTVQWCMQICHKPLSPSVQDQKLWNRLPRLDHFWVQDPKLWNGALQGLTSHGHFWNSTFACTVQWCMQICHKPFSHQLRAIWKCSFTIFFFEKYRFEMAVMHLILQETL